MKAADFVPFDPSRIDFIRRILSVAETGKEEWDPGAVYIYADGNEGRKQCTLSIGFTADGGNLRKFLERYSAEGGAYGIRFAPWVVALKNGDPGIDPHFIGLLKEAAKEDPLFETVQKEAFEDFYLAPAFAWAKDYEFTEPLSYLVIADSFLHSGGMLGFLMQRFVTPKPKSGGNEHDWILDYLHVRHAWLKSHPKNILNNTTYRAEACIEQIIKGDWDLKDAFVMNGTLINSLA